VIKERKPQEGITRCFCGCKYWDRVAGVWRCASCKQSHSQHQKDFARAKQEGWA
jgi:hypothetical protein